MVLVLMLAMAANFAYVHTSPPASPQQAARHPFMLPGTASDSRQRIASSQRRPAALQQTRSMDG